MTKIQGNRIVRRESYDTHYERGKDRPIIVSIEAPNLLGFRLKGTRQTFYLTVEGCYMRAVQIRVAADKVQKAQDKKLRRVRRS
jgi:hypothetical protein